MTVRSARASHLLGEQGWQCCTDESLMRSDCGHHLSLQRPHKCIMGKCSLTETL